MREVRFDRTKPSACRRQEDASGGAEHNQQLSKRRAEAVKAYLVQAGIAAPRLSAVGLGATRPVASNDTAIGRSQNRRVELVRG